MAWTKGVSGNPNGRKIKVEGDWLPGESKEDRAKRRARERSAQWRIDNPERTAEASKRSRVQRKDPEKWVEFLAKERERYAARSEPVLERQKTRRESSPDHVRAIQRKSYLKAPHKAAANCAARRASKARATPPWADLAAIKKLYAEARRLSLETGQKFEVDHIHPLKGKTSCGLHVHWNLQIILREENRKKHNKVLTAET